MDKRGQRTLAVIERLKKRYGTKRRFRNFPFITGLVFEIFQTRWDLKTSIRLMDAILNTYVDWNEFRHTSLKCIQKDLDIPLRDVAFIAYVKKLLTEIYLAVFSFSQERFEEFETAECLQFLTKHGVDRETAAAAMCSYLGKSVMPLTNPIVRCIKRLELFPSKASRKRIRAFFRKLVEENGLDMYQVYRLFREHAEEVCTAKSPDCARCVLMGKECKGES